MCNLRSASIPPPSLHKHKADSFSRAGPRLGTQESQPPPQVLVAAQDRKRGLVFQPPQSKVREETRGSWAQLSLEHLPSM